MENDENRKHRYLAGYTGAKPPSVGMRTVTGGGVEGCETTAILAVGRIGYEVGQVPTPAYRAQLTVEGLLEGGACVNTIERACVASIAAHCLPILMIATHL